MHRLVATTSVLDIVFAANRILDRVSRAIFTANEAFHWAGALSTRRTTTGDRHSQSDDHYTG